MRTVEIRICSTMLLLLAIGVVFSVTNVQAGYQQPSTKHVSGFCNVSLEEFLACEAILEGQPVCDTLDLRDVEVAVHDFAKMIGLVAIKVTAIGYYAPKVKNEHYRDYEAVCVRGKDTFEIRLIQLPPFPNQRRDAMSIKRLQDNPNLHYFRSTDTSFAGLYEIGRGKFYKHMSGRDHHSLVFVKLSKRFNLSVSSSTTNWLGQSINYARGGRIRKAIELVARKLSQPCSELSVVSSDIDSSTSLVVNGVAEARNGTRNLDIGPLANNFQTRPFELSNSVAAVLGVKSHWQSLEVSCSLGKQYCASRIEASSENETIYISTYYSSGRRTERKRILRTAIEENDIGNTINDSGDVETILDSLRGPHHLGCWSVITGVGSVIGFISDGDEELRIRVSGWRRKGKPTLTSEEMHSVLMRLIARSQTLSGFEPCSR